MGRPRWRIATSPPAPVRCVGLRCFLVTLSGAKGLVATCSDLAHVRRFFAALRMTDGPAAMAQRYITSRSRKMRWSSVFPCHPERSEGSRCNMLGPCPREEILRCAQNDRWAGRDGASLCHRSLAKDSLVFGRVAEIREERRVVLPEQRGA